LIFKRAFYGVEMRQNSSIYPETAVLLAPLSGYTDLPFRRSCRRCGCLYAFTPLIDAGGVIHGNPKTETALLRGEDEPWLGVQLLGSDPDLLQRATAAILGRCRFDVIDFNMGCPVPKVLRRGAGAALSRNPELAKRCVEAIVSEARNVPVTAKIRIVSHGDASLTVDLARGLESLGVVAVTVHGRVQERMYSGAVDVRAIAAVREALDIPVIANGGVSDRASGERLRHESGCGRIMVARGAIGNPWLFRELLDEPFFLPSHEELCSVMGEHVLGMLGLYGEGRGMRNARKIILAYLVGRGYPRALRDRVRNLDTSEDFRLFHGELSATPPATDSGDPLPRKTFDQ
jgi:tRNA-dihydrouridine synthase B